jgi:uncharacterized protein (UPF0261 family)
LLIPEKGVSALDIEGGPFFDPDADAALFEALRGDDRGPIRRASCRLPLHINDPAFAKAAVDAFLRSPPEEALMPAIPRKSILDRFHR